MTEDTIVSIVTPFGEGGIGVLRLSGQNSISITESLYKGNKNTLSNSQSHTLHHGWIRQGDLMIDDVVVSLFRAPHSYTGEDVVEISCHGSPLVLRKVVELCQEKGARQAGPGEFTQRAFLNGKMDLSQAEAVAQLISARSQEASKAATDQLQGGLSKRLKPIREHLLNLLAHIEANLDFVEEDIPGLEKKKIKRQLEESLIKCKDLLSTSLKGQILREGYRLAFVGRPNVGKSSLFNALLARDRAIVTSHPGTTRDTLEEQVQWDGFPLVLTDTAGLRPTTNEIERQGTIRTQQASKKADQILFIIDATQPFSKEDQEIYSSFNGSPVVIVLNKKDQSTDYSLKTLVKKFEGKPTVLTSALLNQGLGSLKEKIIESIQAQTKTTLGGPVLTNERHVWHLERAMESLEKTIAALGRKESEEALAMEVRSALKELGAITGEDVNEAMLSKIFATFCIGK